MTNAQVRRDRVSYDVCSAPYPPDAVILVQTSTDANASWDGECGHASEDAPIQTERFASSEPLLTLPFKHTRPHLNRTMPLLTIQTFCHSETSMHLRQAILTVRPVERLIASQPTGTRAGVACQCRQKLCF